MHFPEWGKFLLIWYLALNRALFKSLGSGQIRIFPGLAATIHSVCFVYFFMIHFLKQRFVLVSAIRRQYARGLPARLYILSGFFWCMSEHQRLVVRDKRLFTKRVISSLNFKISGCSYVLADNNGLFVFEIEARLLNRCRGLLLYL